MSSWRPRLIPRKTYQARHKSVSLDAYNLPSDDSPTTFTVENASAQPMKTNERLALQEGYRDRVAYKLFTTTEILAAREGDTSLGDQVCVDGFWCDVIKVDNWNVGVQTHFEAWLVEENER